MSVVPCPDCGEDVQRNTPRGALFNLDATQRRLTHRCQELPMTTPTPPSEPDSQASIWDTCTPAWEDDEVPEGVNRDQYKRPLIIPPMRAGR